MQHALQPLFDQLERQRLEFCAWVENVPRARQHQSPAPAQWSAAQVLYHLALVDKQVLTSLQKKLNSGKPLRPLRWQTRLKSFLLNLVLRLPLKLKAPAALPPVPADVSVEEVVREWQATRAQLRQVLANYPAEQLNREVFFHPRAGMLTMPQTLRFMAAHTEHHRPQLKRLLS
ncbi:DinB family protein [Rufibacter psychrotolerans]|uniref:DinB family protein n=1 Tax=Rufibacter psychrotolerans TaxID=2812556 RepID=UPI001967DB6E|nr:DinB family protein [Rufibacter sp. SYSU D00308]